MGNALRCGWRMASIGFQLYTRHTHLPCVASRIVVGGFWETN